MRCPLLLTSIGAMLLLAGCQSMMHPGSSSLAYVEIANTPLEGIRQTAVRIFAAEHYELLSSNVREMVFVREGTRYDRLQYGRYEERLQMKVVVTLEPFGENRTLVRADAYAVRGGSDFGELKLLRIARRPYQKLLDEVKAFSQLNREVHHIVE